MDRREALKRVGAILGYAVSAPTVAGVLADWEPATRTGAGWTPVTLTGDRSELVAAIAEIILPETDTPGARAAGVDEFVDAMLTRYYPAEDRDAFLAGLEAVDDRARRRHGQPFLGCTAGQQHELVAALDREAFAPGRTAADDGGDDDVAEKALPPAWFRRMKELTLVGYYTSEIGATQELRPMPWGSYQDIPYADVGRSWS